MTTIKKPLMRFALAAGAAMAVSIAVQAHGNKGCDAVPGEAMAPQLRHLDLSEGQRDRIFELLHAQAPALRDKAKAARQAEEQLRALSLSPDYSEAKARALADASAKAMAELRLQRAQSDHALSQLLTPAQRTKLAELKPTQYGRHGHGADGRRAGAEGEVPGKG